MMSGKPQKPYKEYSHLDLTDAHKDIKQKWEQENTFEKSVSTREGGKSYVFYEGPPSANGLPGIHHVMSRTLKDMFCRFKTQQGFKVVRKAGWDTHGLPVELGVEKELGITKEDIGKSISVEEYNEACRKAVMRYTDVWSNLTSEMGYWVNMDDPYITYKTKYIETVWWLLKQIYNKDLLYKGYTIQPYSPKAGTGLSSHELNMPGTYKDVTDTTITAQFKVVADEKSKALFGDEETFLLAWTTTPWTLPSNTALTVGPKIDYSLVETFNPYTQERIRIVLATPLLSSYLKEGDKVDGELENWDGNKKTLPWKVLKSFKGADLVDVRYEQLLPWAQPYQDANQAFRVIPGDFVTTDDGTGIVHTAPTFGADDAKVASAAGVPPMLVLDENDNPVPLVDLQGRFVKSVGEHGGKYVKKEYYNDDEMPDLGVDEEIAIHLKKTNRAFKVQKYVHSYPHCWRTDKPVLYYPLDSWFIRTTAVKDRLISLNKEIQWKPASTGTGRFGNWLENLNDWNLSRSRFWGIPLPIWSTEEGDERIIVGSVEELVNEIDKAVEAGLMDENPYANFEAGNMDEANYDQVDLHRPYADRITLISPSGKPMKREADLIDVWFDSGSMPYAQMHYPFENKERVDSGEVFPADYIAEGVDQTRGWFFTLHAIGTMVFDSVAYKNVVSNGLVLDKNGQKMSKRLGNAVDPFKTMDQYGADATRWYMITNAQPWDNLKFDESGIEEVRRKFFGTLYNTYAFFALYANVDNFTYSEADVPLKDRPEIDRWILSELNTLINDVTSGLESYEPTRAFRAISDFVNDKLSNWYVRLCRRRFWKGTMGTDKLSAYQTLYTCLETVSRLSAPLAPFFMDRLFRDLNAATGKDNSESVHLSQWPSVDNSAIDEDLEERMHLAQQLSSMVLSLRKKEKIRVRQPLRKITVPVLNDTFKNRLSAIENLVASEVNVKAVEAVDESAGMFVKKAKPNFKTLGPKYGQLMKGIAGYVNQMDTDAIRAFEANGSLEIDVNGESVKLESEDIEVSTADIPGMLVASENGVTVALDITLDEELTAEGLAREVVNRIQNLRKDSGLDVTDRISLTLGGSGELQKAVEANSEYVCSEVLAEDWKWEENGDATSVEIDDFTLKVHIEKA
ncbi:isoleucine--tRNA ligase [Phaeocystidibacter luteus]|uniref:Isoleucine--tRNA ligase n=2 Tax=Phaeocystidibacter luteus TaxID=911197 RepID=A0A6N6RET3_9FLAO|nr:isoleucine--tRNA ligase [Phaeocystidibacter luteus]